MKRLLLFILISSLSGCGHRYGTRYVTHYDEGCNVEVRKLYLTKQQTGIFHPGDSCDGEQSCTDLVVGNLLGNPSSVVIAGTIVVAGNALFWMERQGKCLVSD